MSDKTPAGDVEAIKARLDAHDQQRERFGYCDDTAPQTWEADVCALIARIEQDGERMREMAERVRDAEGALAYWRAAKVEAYKRLCHDRCMHGKGLCDFEAICDADLATAHIAALAALKEAPDASL